MTTLKTEHYNISYTALLPDVIDYPIEIIEGLTEKLTEDDNATNLNDIFKWVSLGEKILEKYTEMSNPEIQKFRSALAWALSDMSDEDEKVLEIANTIIKSLENIKEEDGKVVSSYYRLLSSAQNSCGNYKDAMENIHKAIILDENSPNNYCVMGEIFINENEFENAERALKTALEKSIKQNGEDSPHTASIYQSYSRLYWHLYWQTDRDKECLEYAEKAYEIMKKHLGEDNLYTVRCSLHWGIYLFYNRRYKEAFEKMENPTEMLAAIFGKNHKETIISNENVGRILVKMNDYAGAFTYFENVLFITNNADLLIGLSYCNITMDAPELVCKTNKKHIIDEIMLKNSIKCFNNTPLTKAIYQECELFDPIPEKYWEKVAELFAKKIKGEK